METRFDAKGRKCKKLGEEIWDQSAYHRLQEVHEEALVCRYQTMSFLYGQTLDDHISERERKRERER